MTVSTSQSQITVYGNGVTTSFNFPFIAASTSDISVIYTDASGNVTTLTPSQYTLMLNAAAAGQLWGIGGTVTYPTAGSPIANGTSLLISRTVPYTQSVSIQNQSNIYPQVTEQAMDLLEMQIQQAISRTTQFRGTWLTATIYAIGDIVQDGTHGADTNNYYICQVANTSGTWATDLANGDWALSVQAVIPVGSITLTGDVTGSSALGSSTATTIASGVVTGGKIAANTVANSNLAQMAADTIKMNNTVSSATPVDATMAQLNAVLGAVLKVKVQIFTSAGTYTPSAGMLYCGVAMWGGGGGGGGVGSAAGQVMGAGGGAGGYSWNVFSAAAVGASQSVTIGAGGTAGANTGGAGGTGGTTSLGALLTAAGGVGGGGSTTNTVSVLGGAGGAGTVDGVATQGAPGMATSVGSGVNGFTSGFGGSTSLGGGGASVNSTSAVNGNNGTVNSGSGASGASSGAGTAKTGGIGGSGLVIITEFCSQ